MVKNLGGMENVTQPRPMQRPTIRYRVQVRRVILACEICVGRPKRLSDNSP